MKYHHENVQESLHCLLGKATSIAAAKQLSEIIHVLAENLRRSVIQNVATAYRAQIKKGQHNIFPLRDICQKTGFL